MSGIQVSYKGTTLLRFFSSFEEIEDHEEVDTINCSRSGPSTMPDLNFSNLTKLICSSSSLCSMGKLDLPNLELFDCSDNGFALFPEINSPKLEFLDCSRNQFTTLPDLNFPLLKSFNCSMNNLTTLPDLNFPCLEWFDCSGNELTSLPAMDLPQLKSFGCSFNELTTLPDLNFPHLEYLSCGRNNLTELPPLNLPNLKQFFCDNNYLTRLPDLNLPEITFFFCIDNRLTSLPDSIVNMTRLRTIVTTGNELVLTPRQARFINSIRNKPSTKMEVYNDPQNVHNTNIQLCVKESIDRLMTSVDMREYKDEKLIQKILDDYVLNNKDQLVDYVNDKEVHTLLNVTFGEVLWSVLTIIETNFDQETQTEIKTILNQDMKDAECKCFTGRINRCINCLNGFTDLVKINIKDSEQLSNLILLIKDKLGDNYSAKEHKRLVEQEMIERNYTQEEISEWLEFIE